MIDMEQLMEKFIEYATFDKDGNLSGISGDATEEAVEAYGRFTVLQEHAKREGFKI